MDDRAWPGVIEAYRHRLPVGPETPIVTMLEGGFEYEGRPYRSLSAIAREITGSHISGPAFFGVNRGGKQ